MTDIVLYPGEASPNDIRLRAVETIGAFKIGVPIHTGAGATQPRQVYYQSLFLPIYLAAAAVVAQPEGWQAPLSVAAPVARAAQDFGSVPFSSPTVVTVDKWQQPLSIALPPAKPQAGSSFVPFNTAQLSVNFTNFGWHGPTSTAPPVAKAQQGDSSVPYNTVQVIANTVTIDKWQQPLSVAPKVAQAQAGYSFVPYNTAQLAVNYTSFGWYLPLSPAPPVAKAWQGDSFVPYNTVQTAAVAYSTATAIPLDMGGAAPRLRTTYYQSRFDAPYVAPVVVAAYTNFWLQPLSVAVPVARAVSDFGSVPLSSPAVITVDKWQSPLSVAVAVARAPVGYSLVPFNTAQLSVNYTAFTWSQPLSVQPPVVQAQVGWAFVPYNTAQAQPSGIAGMAWFTPLWTVPTRNLTAPQGNSFVPFNTAQQIVVTSPGQRRPTLFIANVGRLMNH